MVIKKVWLDTDEWTLKKTTQANTTRLVVSDAKKEHHMVSADVISWNPETGMLFFKVDSQHIKAHVRQNYEKGRGNKLIVYVYSLQKEITLWLEPPQTQFTEQKSSFAYELTSPLAGRVTKICIEVGDAVSSGHQLVIIESMKMENELCALSDAIVKTIPIKETDLVQSGQVLVTFGEIE